MPTLIFRGADGSEQKASLEAELSVGREAGNDVVLAGSNGVSRKHCRFYLDGDKVMVEDLGSANGTLVGGKKIARATAVPEGTEVTIGDAVATIAAAKRPTGMVKRPAAGTPAPAAGAPRSTRMVAAAEIPSGSGRARPKPVPVAEGGGRPRLKGGSGPFAGKTVDISKARFQVGRTAPADLVLEDDSVSRRHAELVKSPGSVVVRDLGSANGTYVNGERITEAPLSPGDEVRFGVIEFTYQGPGVAKGAGAEASAGGGKKKIIMAAAGVGVLGVIGIIAMVSNQSVQSNVTGPTTLGGNNLAAQQAEAGDKNDPNYAIKKLGFCKAYADPENPENNWEKAAQVCAEVIAADPTLTEARPLEKQAKLEIESKKLMDEAKIKVQTVQEEQALQLLMKIDSKSVSFARARPMFRETAEIIEKQADSNCRTFVKSAEWSSAYQACKRQMELICWKGVDKNSQTRFDLASRNSGHRTADFTCPPEYRRWFDAGGGMNIADDAVPKIEAMYADPDVRKVMLDYYNTGRAKEDSRQLSLMRQKNPAKWKGSLDTLIEKMDLIAGRSASGQSRIAVNDVKNAHVIWQDALDADKNIMPPGVQSAAARDMAVTLSDAYYKMAKDRVAKQQWRDAYDALFNARNLNPRNTDVLAGLNSLEQMARADLDQGSCEGAKEAFDVTLPESLVHKKAEEAKKQLCGE